MNLDSSRRGAKLALRTQLRETVRATILDAAEELIATNGMNGAALVQIARRAGVAVGTLYNYFTDRDALIKALFETRRANLRPRLLAATARGRELSFEPRLRRFVRDVLEAFEAHRRFVKVAIETEHLKLSPSTTSQDLYAAVDDIVAAGASEGVIVKAHAELLAMITAGAIRAVVLRRTADGKPFVDDADAIVTVLMDGARRRP